MRLNESRRNEIKTDREDEELDIRIWMVESRLELLHGCRWCDVLGADEVAYLQVKGDVL
jgi:hypothetical protein